jgi:1-acyl-sn-glycerol-3-phosphate acyltransferase
MLRESVAAVRTFVLVPLVFIYTMALALVILTIGAFSPTASVLDRIVDHWARMFLRIPPVTVVSEGKENVDLSRRYVVAANHLSMFDVPLLLEELPISGRYLSKKELFRLPLIGRAMRTIGIIEVDRQAGGSSRQAINEGVRVAAERGHSLLVFPEGTRSRDGNLLPFKKGAFRIAIDTGLPLLPVIIEGTDRISRPGSKVYRPGTVHIRILEPIETSTMTNRDDLGSLAARVEQSITEHYSALRAAASLAERPRHQS